MPPGNGGFLGIRVRHLHVQSYAFALHSLWLGKSPSERGTVRANLA